MKRSLKSFFRKGASSRKGSGSETTHSRPEIRLGPAQLLEQRKCEPEDDRQTAISQPRGRVSVTQSSKASSRYGSSHPASRRRSSQRSISTNEDLFVAPIDHAPHPGDVSDEREDSIADDCRAYMPATSPGSIPSAEVEFMSLGGDSRLRTGNSEMRHNEDIADRNIDTYGARPSQHSSLRSQHRDGQVRQDRTERRKSIAASIASLGSPDSVGSSVSLQPKYMLGSGVATEGSLIDGILPHVKDAHPRPYNRKDWPSRLARDESHLDERRRHRRESNEVDLSNPRRESLGRRNEKPTEEMTGGSVDLLEAIMGGPEDYDAGMRANLDGIVDLRDTEDSDKKTRWAPGKSVTHEVVKPTEHEIIEERIYREVHDYEVYHYIQPVYETEILPARHFVYNSNNELVEVPASQLPKRTGTSQRWCIVRGDEETPAAHLVRSPPQAREPRIIADKRYITPDGFERRETTWLHPPELEDMSNYNGPIVPIEFFHHPEHAPERELKRTDKGSDHVSNGKKLTMTELSDALPVVLEIGPPSPLATAVYLLSLRMIIQARISETTKKIEEAADKTVKEKSVLNRWQTTAISCPNAPLDGQARVRCSPSSSPSTAVAVKQKAAPRMCKISGRATEEGER
ncbi:hypothetical protein N0V90_006769 [Kalmusia sp. IMI 367209]|nr:hypothetical protein N0V90_006769 [Kalmusia sp. IMI 367209]